MAQATFANKGGSLANGDADRQRIPTNLRVLRIIEIIARSDEALTPAEINREINLPKATVHRLCRTLEAEGYVVRDRSRGKLRPGRRLRSLSSGILHASSAHIARHQVLQVIATEVRETVNFVVAEEQGMRYLDRVETDWPFRIQLPIGTNVPFHCTASGKMFMASLPEPECKAFVNALPLTRLTANTHVESSTLLADIKEIRLNNYALDRGEFIEDMNAVAVPVFSPDNVWAAAIAIHGPVQRLSLQAAVARVGILHEGARRLQRALFP